MPRRPTDTALDAFLEHGIHLPSRTVILSGEVDDQMVRSVLAARTLCDAESQVLTVEIHTSGGDIYAGLGVYDVLRGCKGVVKTVGYGAIFSCGGLILQAADGVELGGGRWLAPNATLMLHAGYASQPEDHPEQLLRSAKEDLRVRNLAWGIVAKRMGISIKKFNERFKFDVFMGAEKAREEGLVDGVLGG